MARIVDVKAFLENFPFESTAKPFHFVVKDPVAEWNNGIFGLIWDENDQVTITDEPLGTAVHLDIQTLTCLVMNYRRPSYLHRIERIDTDKETLNSLERIFLIKKLISVIISKPLDWRQTNDKNLFCRTFIFAS